MVNGGNATTNTGTVNDFGGGGGGGRIRIGWTTSTFTGTISAKGGIKGDNDGWIGHPGTYSFPDGQSLTVTEDIALAPGTYNIPVLLVTNGAILSCQGDTNSTYGTGVIINASDVMITTGATISVIGQGFWNNAGVGKGQNETGANGGGGGGYGGAGGNAGGGALGGTTYGTSNAPTALGSGGGNGTSELGGWGSGAVKIIASSRTAVDGTITAEGESSGFRAGAGSGGSIWIHTEQFDGQGALNADGGDVYSRGTTDKGGGGGGGRIFVSYVSKGFSGAMTAAGGSHGDDGGQDGQAGTACEEIRTGMGSVFMFN